MHILVINPGSTSTKIAVYHHQDVIFEYKVSHSTEEIRQFQRIIDQYDMRKNAILKALEMANIPLDSLNAVCGRGGMLKPIESGTYRINAAMIQDLMEAKRGEHASNLGALIAHEIASLKGIPAFIVDPVSVDEMDNIARISGMPWIERQSLFHALNQKAIAREAAAILQKPYAETNLIIAHLGGGISVGVHKQGRVIDVNNALDGDGPFSPERSGSVPLGPLYKAAYHHTYTLDQIKRFNYGQGGLAAYLGTNDALEVVKRICHNDHHAKEVYEAMAYQIAKEIASGASVLKGDVDAIVITGGLAYEDMLVHWIEERVLFIAKVLVIPGENEMKALALGALRVLLNEEQAKEY